MKYALWIPITILYNFIVCWIAVHVGHRDFTRNYVWIVIASLIPSWALASYYSTNLIFDGLLYDATLIVSGVIIMASMGQAEKFVLMNWVGVIITIIGLIMARWPWGTK